MEILARASFSPHLVREACDLAHFCRHKILKSDPSALSKAGGRWYIPPATSRSLGPRVAFSGSLWTEATPLGVDLSVSAFRKGVHGFIAGWSSPVARQAHNLKVIGSNPIPATTDTDTPAATAAGVFVFIDFCRSWRVIQLKIVPNSP